MQLAHAMRRTLVFAGFAFASISGACVGTPALAADDQSTIVSVLGLFGLSWGGNAEKIDYREHGKLVLPPNRQALPEPQARGDARPGAWPVDQDVQRKNIHAAARAPAPQPSLNQNPALSPNELARGGAAPEEAKVGAKEAENKNAVVADHEPNRDYLTEPPRGYRQPTKATLAAEKEEGWPNPAAYLRRQAGRIFGGQ